MDYCKFIQQTIDYIEEHLSDKLTLKELSNNVNFSMFHYHRVFQAVVGDTVTDYIRKRRLSRAAEKLIAEDCKVIDVAYEFQFGCEDSFARAFRRLYGITPGRYRREKPKVSLYKRIYVDGGYIKNRMGGHLMEPRMIHCEEIKIIGKEVRVRSDGENYIRIPEFWDECIKEGLFSKIPNVTNPYVSYGICWNDFDPETSKFTYVIAMPVTSFDKVPQGMVAKTIPAQDYAVFTARGKCPEAIQETWKKVNGCMVEKGLEHSGGIDFEYYDERSMANDENCEVDIYIPVKTF